MRVVTLNGTDTIVVAILAYFLGRFLTAKIGVLEIYRIPEAVTGGLLVALVVALIRSVGGIELEFTTGPVALLFFFASIGLNASIRDLAAGGRPLVLLLAIAAVALLVQNIIGAICAWLLGAAPLLGLMAGSVSLLGGHGTAAAWGAIFAEHTHLAPVIGLASATFGLIAGGVIGGPVGRYLIERYRLRGDRGRRPDPRDGRRRADRGADRRALDLRLDPARWHWQSGWATRSAGRSGGLASSCRRSSPRSLPAS